MAVRKAKGVAVAYSDFFPRWGHNPPFIPPLHKGGFVILYLGEIQQKSKGLHSLRMKRKHNANLKTTARVLRKNMTPEEKHLWYDFLCTYPLRFSRQKVLGEYIADFYCADAKLVIELDGSGHYTEEGEKKDKKRTSFLECYGLTVIRIPNTEIRQNFRGVCEYIDALVKQVLSTQ